MITLEYLENIMPFSNIDLSWINDTDGYKEASNEAGSDYMKGNNDKKI